MILGFLAAVIGVICFLIQRERCTTEVGRMFCTLGTFVVVILGFINLVLYAK